MTATGRSMDLPPFVCPSCGADLDRPTADVFFCHGERTSYRKIAGIWHFLMPARAEYFERFVAEYDCVRLLEGRGSDSSLHYRALPYADPVGGFWSDWKVRSASFDCFVERVLAPLEHRSRERPGGRLRVLDLGAGNGWLSSRLALRGHELVALDLRTNEVDGLGAHVHYESRFTCVRAEFDRLPFRKESFDVAVFNASLHYSENFGRTLREALRVVRPDGLVSILDTPVYRNPESGSEMIRGRKRRFLNEYGVSSDSIPAEEFLTEERLAQLSEELEISWMREEPRYGVGWTIRRAVSRIRNRREPARFAVLSACRSRIPDAPSRRELRPVT